MMYDEIDPQMNSSSPYYQPTILASEKADLIEKINPAAIVEILKYSLMGYEYDKKNLQWIKTRDGMNAEGAFQIATLMLSVSSRNVAISKLSDAEIRGRTRQIHKAAMKMCIANWLEWEIKSRSQIRLISQIVLSNTFITLKQPENAGIRELMKSTTQESRNIVEQPKKEGRFGKLFRR